MNKRCFHVFCILFLVLNTGCASENENNVKSEEPIIEITYVLENISQERPLFGQDLLPVREGALWGYVDKSGTFIIEPKYYIAHTFRSNGLAIVAASSGPSNYGVIDLEGNWVIKPSSTYYSITQLDNGTFYVNSTNGDLIIDRNNYRIFDQTKFNNDIQINDEITRKYEYSSMSDIGYGLEMFVANIQYSDGERVCGYMNMDLEWAIEPKFSSCLGFGGNGLAMASIDPESILNNYGFINTSGEFVLQPRADWSYGMYDNRFNQNGYANMSDNETNLNGVIDSNGNYVIEPKYYQLSNFVDNLAVIYNEKTIDIYNYTFTYGVIDVNGKTIVKEGLYTELGPISNGFILYRDKKTSKVGYLNYQGEVAIKAQFQETQQTDTLSWDNFDQMTGRFMDDGFAVVILNDKLNVIDKDGNLLFENGFDEIYEYDEYLDPYNVIRFNN